MVNQSTNKSKGKSLQVCAECGRLRALQPKDCACSVCGNMGQPIQVFPATASKIATEYDAQLVWRKKWEEEKNIFIYRHGWDAWEQKVKKDLAELF